MKYCPKCGSRMDDADEFCLHCGEKFIEKVDVTPRYKGLSKDKKLAVVSVILIVLFSTISLSILVYEEEKYKMIENDYSQLGDSYNQLKDSYNSLESQHSRLTADYSTLSNQFNDLNTKYNALSQITTQYSQLPINHLMELMNNKIREECQPNYNPWWSTYYYDKTSVEYAASVCAHDLGRRYWPTIENDYYKITGTELSNDAHNKIIKLIEIIDVSRQDSAVEKIEKILDFTSTHITYQSDLNDEFLFPTETITFRSGDCDDFSILAATLFEEASIESAIGFFENTSENAAHCMVLVHLPDLGNYGYWYYSNLTSYGLSEGKWIILEPQADISAQRNENLIEKWTINVAAEIPDE